jgi:hypothetical protein
MSYTLDQFSADCRAALLKDPGPAGRELVRQYTEKACSDPDFVAKYLGADADAERKILYEDPELHFCILAHVYRGAKNSAPHDHGPRRLGRRSTATCKAKARFWLLSSQRGSRRG